MNHLLCLGDLQPADLDVLLDLADDLRRHPRRVRRELAGELVVLYFTESSTRTRLTFAGAAQRLGAAVVVLGPTEFQDGWGARTHDVGRLASLYAAAIVTCTDETRLHRLAEAASIPVVNGRSDRHHPCQSLADLLTLREELGALEGRRVCLVGEADAAAHSFMQACALAGVDLTVLSPPGHEPHPDVTAAAQAIAARTKAALRVDDDPRGAVERADAIYAGTWFRLGLSDAETVARQRALGPFVTVAELVYRLAPSALFLQTLAPNPADQVTPALARCLRTVTRHQVANREQVAGAILLAFHQRRVGSTDQRQPQVTLDVREVPTPVIAERRWL